MGRADAHRRHAFLLIDGTGRRHLFCAENDAERNEWVQVLQLHIEMMEPITLSAMLGPEGRGDKPAAAAAASTDSVAGVAASSSSAAEDDVDAAPVAITAATRPPGDESDDDDDDNDDDDDGADVGDGVGTATTAEGTAGGGHAPVERTVVHAGRLEARIGVLGRLAGTKPYYCELDNRHVLSYHKGERPESLAVRERPSPMALALPPAHWRRHRRLVAALTGLGPAGGHASVGAGHRRGAARHGRRRQRVRPCRAHCHGRWQGARRRLLPPRLCCGQRGRPRCVDVGAGAVCVR